MYALELGRFQGIGSRESGRNHQIHDYRGIVHPIPLLFHRFPLLEQE